MSALQYNTKTIHWAGWQLEAINESLAGAAPQTIALWALAQRLPTMVSTSFGTESAALLHLMSGLDDELPVLWVDTGFAPADTRDFAQALTERFNLNLHTYRPAESAIAILNDFGVTDPLALSGKDRALFASRVKLQPFQRAVADLAPQVWITGIRAEETEFRRTLAPVTLDERGVLKVAPFFAATQADIEGYLVQHDLPVNRGYFDPTKPAAHLECGLHR